MGLGRRARRSAARRSKEPACVFRSVMSRAGRRVAPRGRSSGQRARNREDGEGSAREDAHPLRTGGPMLGGAPVPSSPRAKPRSPTTATAHRPRPPAALPAALRERPARSPARFACIARCFAPRRALAFSRAGPVPESATGRTARRRARRGKTPSSSWGCRSISCVENCHCQHTSHGRAARRGREKHQLAKILGKETGCIGAVSR